MITFNRTPIGKTLATALAATLLTATLFAEGSLSLTPQPNVIYEGTPIHVRLAHTISSATSQTGDQVDFEVLGDINVNGNIVIPTGSFAVGTVTEAAPKRRMGRGGKLEVNIDYIRLPSGVKLPLRGVQIVKGGGHGAVMTTGIVATAVVFWPAAPLFLLMQGKDIVIPQGHESNLYTSVDYKIPASAQPVVPAQVPIAAPASVPTVPVALQQEAKRGCRPVGNNWCVTE